MSERIMYSMDNNRPPVVEERRRKRRRMRRRERKRERRREINTINGIKLDNIFCSLST